MAVTVRQRIEFVVFRALICLVECLPVRTAARCADALATVVHYGLPRRWTRFALAAENIRRAFGPSLSDADVDRMIFGMWRHLFRIVAEIVQMRRKLHLHSYRRCVEFQGIAETVAALTSGRRLLLLGGHFGNWEVSTGLFGVWGFPMGVVAREMDNPLLHAWFERERQRLGHRLMLKRGGLDDMLVQLQRGGNLGLLCDQDAGPKGLFVDFFGTPASTFKSIALLALEYDALVVVGCATRLPDEFDEVGWSRFAIRGELVLDPRTLVTNDPAREITEAYTAALERAIRRAPEQYFWVHRRWKSVPKRREKALPVREAA